MGPTSLPILEISTYFIIWVAGVFYSVYQIHLTGNYFSHNGNTITSDDFVPGWSFLDRKKDNADFEWKIWIDFLITVSPWLVAHLFISEIIRYYYLQLLPFWYLLTSISFTSSFIGVYLTAMIILQPCVFFMILSLRSSVAIWATSIAMLATLNSDFTDWLEISEVHQYFLVVCIAWTHLRCVSFCFDHLSDSKDSPELLDFIYFLSFIFYLPTLFLGPVILYSKFKTGLTSPYKTWTLQRLALFVLNIGRFTGWLLFTEFALHFVYCNALIYQPEVVERLGPWALCGLGYSMGQFFMNKYTVCYGLAGTTARAEQIDAPNHPKCISRIHLYSDMWKHFDRGLYAFLVKYIYIPCLGISPHIFRRLGASFICFCFIYVWHHTYKFVLVWSLLNFLGVTVEGFAKIIQSTDYYQTLQKKVSPGNVRRINCLMATPLFAMSCISNFYFFAGMEIGNIYARRFTKDGFFNVYVIFFCYCCCQVSTEVKIWEGRRRICRSALFSNQ